ncbi:hypothetical protein IHP37_09895 [Enterococcus faecalis]|uniref:hypothetical protein n=1 Tax=Enterococcus faecalis TaxID=1351 RepID=UPI00178218CD|nr:hypothetical protein [Enterococcus faecalis]MBD9774089.1 hypothetical protein [Enterococcus faecalis]MBD9792668.1 hypothetical protein [Enterococcus faecalis]MBD9797519.1 hypothetical protein [Enterococcus faecalis]
MKSNKYSDKKIQAELVNEVEKCYYLIIDKLNKEEILFEGECKIFCVNEKIHTKKEVASVE